MKKEEIEKIMANFHEYKAKKLGYVKQEKSIDKDILLYSYISDDIYTIIFYMKENKLLSIDILMTKIEDFNDPKKNSRIIKSIISEDIDREDINDFLRKLLTNIMPEEVEIYNVDSCPICDSKINFTKFSSMGKSSCENKCYKKDVFYDNDGEIGVTYFSIMEDINSVYSVYADYDRNSICNENKVKHLINRWKKNDRYLIYKMGCFEEHIEDLMFLF